MKQILNDTDLLNCLYHGTFGIEVEEHRVSIERKSLSQLSHPDTLGERHGHPFFQTDFAESQEELVSLPHSSTRNCLSHLHSLQAMLQANLAPDDVIWPLSMPPKLNQADLTYLPEGFKQRPWYQKYLEKMLEKYGPFYGLMAGIHINYAPTQDLLDWYHVNHDYPTKVSSNNHMMFQIVQQVLGYRWMLTYLFGASPITENQADTIPAKQHAMAPVRSYRSSKYGFNNLANFKTDYSNLENFIDQLEHFIETGKLVAPSDFHGPVRLKGAATFEDLMTHGAKYLEFRVFDLNPFTQDGISQNTMSFLHLLIMDAIVNPQVWNHDTMENAENLNDEVALQHPNEHVSLDAQVSATKLFTRLADLVKSAPADLRIDFSKALNYAITAFDNPEQTVSAQLTTFVKDNSLVDFGMKRGAMIKNDFAIEPDFSKFRRVPKQLLSAYQESHKLGLKTTILEDKLSVTFKTQPKTFNNDYEFEDNLSSLTERN
ncbi:glutamate--cysteine ligase [Fructilactobacillus sp. Tb1]|uniref:glutamate--cysteine ligase n=1 Tax=Fructilactobacillus sp. Tb1 TaxID=3422304 RepID=UPI003D2DF10E